MESAKQDIFSALRASAAEQFPMPDLSPLEAQAVRYDDPLSAFCEAFKAAGGVVAEDTVEAAEDEFTVNGVFGVAENGAIWIDSLPQDAVRRDLFIHERLIVNLDGSQIVNNMHEAYKRLGESANGYGIFISGPSKTADIEQALVFGAHGPKEMIVLLR